MKSKQARKNKNNINKLSQFSNIVSTIRTQLEKDKFYPKKI